MRVYIIDPHKRTVTSEETNNLHENVILRLGPGAESKQMNQAGDLVFVADQYEVVKDNSNFFIIQGMRPLVGLGIVVRRAKNEFRDEFTDPKLSLYDLQLITRFMSPGETLVYLSRKML